ncbi:hypothetical protein C1645_835237 [Glomus cerebriforme]|uniref:Uncharacterized protein n=1 Tax=Glomus cerebriforme TaxID=658196 RepID=A0A397SE47_9GLOM|nr:hypothetical protein C1645_835237 [Glomus cerebriforme]
MDTAFKGILLEVHTEVNIDQDFIQTPSEASLKQKSREAKTYIKYLATIVTNCPFDDGNCQGMTIPYAMIDSGSDLSKISENVAKHLELKIDRKKVHKPNGIASKAQSLGSVDDIPVTIGDGKNSLTATDDFSVIPTEYDNNEKELSYLFLALNGRIKTLIKRRI